MTHFLSWWEKSVILRPYDFAVLGAGLIGKQIAIKIKRKYPEARIALIDRSPVSYGASTRNAGFACFGSVSEILDDLKRSTPDDVYALLGKRYRGIRMLIDEYGAGQIGFRGTGSYEVFTNADDMEMALSAFEGINAEIRSRHGLESVFSVRSAASNGMKVLPHTLFNPYEGMLNSGLLNEAVSDTAHRLGIIPLYGLEVLSLETLNDGVLLQTAQGIDIKAGQLVVANNAFAATLLPVLDVEPARGQIILSNELNDLPFDGIFHADKGYIYFRNLGKRVLIGGGRNLFREQEKTFDFSGSTDLRQHLEEYLRTIILPGRTFETEMHWSGIMAMGAEKIPLVQRMNKHLLFCVRMSGMGVALGPELSDDIAAML